ncbi:MAG: hypothetical protein K1X75_12300 [Leptospirales bacterium]|nr:hypothetical protein [Leptospirales bacterium]
MRAAWKIALALALALPGACQLRFFESSASEIPSVRALGAYHFNPASDPLSRITLPPAPTLRYLEEIDERSYRAYLPTAAERASIRAGLERLPPLHRAVLQRRVVGLYFIEDFASNGLADWVVDEDGSLYCFLAFHPRILRMSAREIILQRERTNFIEDRSGASFDIEVGGDESAWTYLAVHELTHAVDYTLRVTPYTEPGSRELQQRIAPVANLARDYWLDYSRPKPEYDFPLRAQITFYGFHNGPRIPLAQSADLYRQLSGSPFVSLYASRIWAEDAAELVSHYHLSEKLGHRYILRATSSQGEVFEYEPLKSELIRQRFPALEVFYQQ